MRIFTVVLLITLISFKPNFSQDLDSDYILDFVMPSVVKIEAGNSIGSGVIVNLDGYIITNYHVIEEQVERKRNIKIITSDKKQFNVIKVIDYDDDLDLAILKTDAMPTQLACLIAHPDSIRAGQDVYAVGSPFGFQNYVTKGIVSKYTTPYLFTTATVNPGNSGGALVNTRAELYGLPTMSFTAAQSVSVAVCVRSVRYFLELNKVKYNE